MRIYGRICPECGARLDPGEICWDCQEKEKAASRGANTESGTMIQGIAESTLEPGNDLKPNIAIIAEK